MKNKKLKSVFVVSCLVLVSITVLFVSASDTGATSPGTTDNVDDDTGIAWTNIDNSQSQSNTYASVSSASVDHSDFIYAHNFGFDIIADATIDGVKFEIDKYASDDAALKFAIDRYMYIVDENGVSGTDKADTVTKWATRDRDTYVSYGGATDNWGDELVTGADVNNANFGCKFSCEVLAGIGSTTAYVDHIRVTVYYSKANTAPTQSAHKVLDSETNHTLNATNVLIPPTSFWITVNDVNGDKMNVTIMENSSGWKTVNQTTGSGLSNGVYSFINVSWITSYNTKYYITFNVTDGTDWCNETYHFTTESASLSFSVVTSSSGDYLHFNDWTISNPGFGLTTEYNVSEDNQTATMPAINISNTGNVALNFSINWTGDPGTGISLKWNTSNNPPLYGENTIAEDPATTQIVTNLGIGEYEEIWLWMDFVTVTAQSSQQDIKLWSELYNG